MLQIAEEQYGRLALTNIFTTVWMGDWNRYETIFDNMNGSLQEGFPFHSEYNRKQVLLWHENHFLIPGDYFVSPYFSSYMDINSDVEERKKNLLCLIGMYEKMGFYFPLEQELYPDHIACLTALIAALQQERIKALEHNEYQVNEQLAQLEQEIAVTYILPTIKSMQKISDAKLKHPFFKEFLTFYSETMKEEYKEWELS